MTEQTPKTPPQASAQQALILPSREYIHSVLMARSAEIQKQAPPPPQSANDQG